MGCNVLMDEGTFGYVGTRWTIGHDLVYEPTKRLASCLRQLGQFGVQRPIDIMIGSRGTGCQ